MCWELPTARCARWCVKAACLPCGSGGVCGSTPPTCGGSSRTQSSPRTGVLSEYAHDADGGRAGRAQCKGHEGTPQRRRLVLHLSLARGRRPESEHRHGRRRPVLAQLPRGLRHTGHHRTSRPHDEGPDANEASGRGAFGTSRGIEPGRSEGGKHSKVIHISGRRCGRTQADAWSMLQAMGLPQRCGRARRRNRALEPAPEPKGHSPHATPG